MCVCVCVRERERVCNAKTARKKKSENEMFNEYIVWLQCHKYEKIIIHVYLFIGH